MSRRSSLRTAARAIQRLSPHLEVRSVTTLAEAESVLAREPVATIFVASGLDSQTHAQTIRWFADKAGDAPVIALLERCDDGQRQEALEGGASYICSKPELLVADSDEAGRGFRFEAGHDSDLKPARTTASPQVVVDDRDRGGFGQGAGCGAWRFRRLSPESSIR